MNPLIQGHSGTAPETSRNAFGTNQGTDEDDSQSDPHPEAGIFRSQTTQNSGPEVDHGNSDTQRICLGYPYPSLWMKTKIFPLVKQSSHLIMMLRIHIHASHSLKFLLRFKSSCFRKFHAISPRTRSNLFQSEHNVNDCKMNLFWELR